MYQLVASDLDGTLLSSDHTLSSYTKKTLKLLTKNGIKLAFATGRHYLDVICICNNLKIKAYMITSNGARIHDMNGNIIFTKNIDCDIANNLLNIVYDHNDIITNLYYSDKWFASKHHSMNMHIFKNINFNYSIYKPELLDLRKINKIFYICKRHELLLSLEKQINTIWGNRINVNFSSLTCLEVTSEYVSKGYALKKVVNHIGCQLKDCIAFGDGMNDAEMLSIAGKSCIMGNAYQRLKDMFPNLEVIGTNNDNAVSFYLSKILLDNLLPKK